MRGKDGTKAIVIGVIVLMVLIGSALVFVVALRPASSEYNNTIPAVMGMLTMISTVVSTLLIVLKNQQNHKENRAELPKAVERAVEHITQDLPIVRLKSEDSP